MIVLVLLAFLAGCAAPIASSRDPVLDARATELDGKIEAFLDAMEHAAEKPEGTYQPNAQFYMEARGEIEILRRRATSRSSSGEAKILADVAEHLELLRKGHEGGGGGLNRVLVEQIRPMIRASFVALYRSESQ